MSFGNDLPAKAGGNEESMSSLVELKGVSKSYDNKLLAVNNVNLSLPRGKIIGLLGPNGSGKTTMIKMINGILAPTAGEIRIAGMPVGPGTKARVAYLPDRNYLTGNKTVEQVFHYFDDFYENFSMQKALGMLESLHIQPEARLNSLSKGTKEKVQLILVMGRDADLYVLDEPIAGVDPAARDYILRAIIDNYNPEATVLISTHLITDIENVLDEVVFVRRGQIVLYNSADKIREEKGKSVDAYFREVFAC